LRGWEGEKRKGAIGVIKVRDLLTKRGEAVRA
jgi:hypothetical protein